MKKQRHFRGMFVLILAVSFAVGAGSGYVIKHRKTAATAESRVVAEAERDTAPIQVMQPEEGDTAPISDEEIPQTEIECVCGAGNAVGHADGCAVVRKGRRRRNDPG